MLHTHIYKYIPSSTKLTSTLRPEIKIHVLDFAVYHQNKINVKLPSVFK